MQRHDMTSSPTYRVYKYPFPRSSLLSSDLLHKFLSWVLLTSDSMDGSSAPSFNGPPAEPSNSSVNDPYYAAGKAAPSYKDMNIGRPVSGTPDQPHRRAIDGESDMKGPPTYKDVAQRLGQSLKAPAADAGKVNREPVVDTIQDGQKPYSLEDIAAAHKHVSAIAGPSPYDQEGKMPSNGGVRPINHSSGGQQGGYQYMSGPKSYNGDNFGKYW
ncbi:unnamed protein product [Lactuca virosa]|uniref:Uncharacterized protein n=1 Tax=Lactuca virosa TaxID=75947 RepID=A0AAU9NFS8_9ASTR|nr:unnamed protein product [Lactuca virosa]